MTPDQFKTWRERLGLSLTVAAEQLGVSRQAVLYYQNGQRPISKAICLACMAIEGGLKCDK